MAAQRKQAGGCSGVDAVADGLDLVVLAVDVVQGVVHGQLCDEIVGRVGVVAAVRGEQHVVAADERAGELFSGS